MGRIVERQVERVRRRLLLGAVLASLAWAWTGALALAAVWFALQPLLVPQGSAQLRGLVAAALVGLATVSALVRAWRAAPTALAAALALDERFALKERATTALTLPDDKAQTPMGRALLENAEGKAAGLRVGERFPVRLPRAAALVPVGVLSLALLALFWNPRFGGKAATDEPPLAEAEAGIEAAMKKLAAFPPRKKEAEAQASKEEIDRIDADLERLARKPRETREQLRERIKDAQAIEDEIRKQLRQDQERAEGFKEQMRQLARLHRQERKGPADKLADALLGGDMEKAAQRMQELAEQLRDPKAGEAQEKKAEDGSKRLEGKRPLGDKDREVLQKQMERMEDDLKQLSREKKDRQEALDKRADLERDRLDRERAELDKNADALTEQERKELLGLSKKLGECRQCLKSGQEGEAAQKLSEAGEMAAKMAGKQGGGEELERRLAQVGEARKALCRGLGGDDPAAGRRPLGADKGGAAKVEEWSPAHTGKGKLRITGDGPKGGFKGARRPEELAEEIRQAAQEAPAAIDRQRLPPGARKMARGYFEKVRAQQEAAKKP